MEEFPRWLRNKTPSVLRAGSKVEMDMYGMRICPRNLVTGRLVQLKYL